MFVGVQQYIRRAGLCVNILYVVCTVPPSVHIAYLCNAPFYTYRIAGNFGKH